MVLNFPNSLQIWWDFVNFNLFLSLQRQTTVPISLTVTQLDLVKTSNCHKKSVQELTTFPFETIQQTVKRQEIKYPIQLKTGRRKKKRNSYSQNPLTDSKKLKILECTAE